MSTSLSIRISQILAQVNSSLKARNKPPVYIASKLPEKSCFACGFVLAGEFAKWNGCPNCREPFFAYDALQPEEPKSEIEKAVENFNKLAAQFESPAAVIEAVGEYEVPCSWCHGNQGWYRYGTGDDWEMCSVCDGSGLKEGA